MANDKKNINELVTDDDDPTAELEAIVLQPFAADVELESGANTAEFNQGAIIEHEGDAGMAALRFDLRARAEAISRLEFEVAQLHARCLGLEAESTSREEVSNQLLSKLETATKSLASRQKLLKKRDWQIKSLRLEIRERNANFLSLQEQLNALDKHVASREDGQQPADIDATALNNGQLASRDYAIQELQQRYVRVESYADQLRQQLQDHELEAKSNRKSRELLQYDLTQATDRIAALKLVIADLNEQNAQLNTTLQSLHTSHAEEIRTIRFELGEAQSTLTQHELLTEQLASDLVVTRNYRVELENMLSATEENSNSRIEKLEKDNRVLRREISEARQKLETKNEAINCLISELAKKSHQVDVVEDLPSVMDQGASQVFGRGDSQIPTERDRITRVLVGSIDDQEVRFPLFKDRLTIGRTEHNDIQLKAAHISRRHAVIVSEGGATRVIDWGSKNGVFVNSTRITEHFLKNGDVVSVGTSEFRYEERAKRDPRGKIE
jgi:chromosome segregation ATPase